MNPLPFLRRAALAALIAATPATAKKKEAGVEQIRVEHEVRKIEGWTVHVDVSLPDLGGGSPADLVPLVSDNWRNHFKWRGKGKIPAEELAKLEELVARTHKEGCILRFWAVPDNEACWRILHDAGVDLINTDKLAELAVFLRQQ